MYLLFPSAEQRCRFVEAVDGETHVRVEHTNHPIVRA
jgi:hypothetical protein